MNYVLTSFKRPSTNVLTIAQVKDFWWLFFFGGSTQVCSCFLFRPGVSEPSNSINNYRFGHHFSAYHRGKTKSWEKLYVRIKSTNMLEFF